MQLEAYERSRAGNSAAYKKSAASAMARLSSLSRKASVTRDTANLAREGSLASQSQEGPSEDSFEGLLSQSALSWVEFWIHHRTRSAGCGEINSLAAMTMLTT